MPEAQRTITVLTCNRCGYEWTPIKADQRPGTCANPLCRSPYWDKERVRKLRQPSSS